MCPGFPMTFTDHRNTRFFFTSDQVKGLSKGQYRDFKELSLDLKAVMTRFSLPSTLRKESG